ncbi:MAG: hypothetical protein ABSB78_10240 [Bacteroidota bacterium]
MYRQCQKKYASFLKLFLVGIVVMIGIGCDSILPEKFKNKEYTIADIDSRACIILSDTTGKSIQTMTLQGFVDTATWRRFTQDSLTENQVLYPKFSVLVDSLPQLVRDSLMVVGYPKGENTTYSVLRVLPGESKDIYIYTSLFYNADNVNEYISIRLMKSDTIDVNYSNDMVGETISGSTQTILVQSEERIVPTIRSRNKIHVEEGVYLVRFGMSNPVTINKFKILILSL